MQHIVIATNVAPPSGTRVSSDLSLCALLLVLAGGLAARALLGLALAGRIAPRDPEERGVRHGCERVQDKGRRDIGCRRCTSIQNHERRVEGERHANTLLLV